jgi:hypothetical protein
MILSLFSRSGFRLPFGNCLLPVYLLKRTLPTKAPFQKLFIRELEMAPVLLTTLSANDLRSRLSGLYQVASVRFSDAVLDMRFRKGHLAQDIAKFRTYALHSHFSSTLDKNEWIYAQARKKMQAGWPQCFLLASTEFQLTLDPTLRFSAYVDQALKIAAHLQSQSTLRPHPTGMSHPTGNSNPHGLAVAKSSSVQVPRKRTVAAAASQETIKAHTCAIVRCKYVAVMR